MKIEDIVIKEKINIGDVNIGVKKLTPSLIDLEVTPTTEIQEFTHEGEYGYDNVKVNAVDNTIDSNITSNNIRNGVSILGVQGNIEPLESTTLEVNPTSETQVFTPEEPYNGFSEVQVNGVVGEDKEVTITENGTQTILPTEGYSNLSSVEVTTQVAQGTDFERNGTLTGAYGFMKNFNKIKLYKNNNPTDKDYSHYCEHFTGATEIDFSEFMDFDINKDVTACGYFFSECRSLPQIDLNEIGLKDIRTDKINKSFGLLYFANNCVNLESAKLPTIEIPTLETRPHYEATTVVYDQKFNDGDYTGSGTNWTKKTSSDKCANGRGCPTRRYFEQLTEGVVYYKLIPTSETTGYFEEDPNPEVVYFDEFKTDISSTQYMFNGCNKLSEVDFGGNDLIMSSTLKSNYQYMFYGCTSLMKINAPNVEWHNISEAPINMLGGTSTSYRVPYDCEIIVKDQTEKDWFNTNFPNYTNVKIKSEVVE